MTPKVMCERSGWLKINNPLHYKLGLLYSGPFLLIQTLVKCLKIADVLKTASGRINVGVKYNTQTQKAAESFRRKDRKLLYIDYTWKLLKWHYSIS